MKPDDIFSRLYPSETRTQKQMNPTPFPKETPLAMSYIYFQQWGETSSPEIALQNGTLFPDLNKPFERGAE